MTPEQAQAEQFFRRSSYLPLSCEEAGKRLNLPSSMLMMTAKELSERYSETHLKVANWRLSRLQQRLPKVADARVKKRACKK